MGRAFGTNITNTVGTVASKPIPKVVQNRSLSTSSLPTNVTIKHEFKNESSTVNHNGNDVIVTSSVLKPKPVFACAPVGTCLNQFSSHDQTSGSNFRSNSQPIKTTNQCLTPTLGRSLSDSGFGSIPRLKLRQMPNILRRKRKSSSSSVFNSTPAEVSISTTPIINDRNDFWPQYDLIMTRLTFGRPVRPWKNQNVVKSGCILYYFRKTFLWFLIIFGFFPILKKLVRISIVMGTRFPCIRNVTCNKTEILDFINQMPLRNISLKIHHGTYFYGSFPPK